MPAVTGAELPAVRDVAEGIELAIKDAKACLAAARGPVRNGMQTPSAVTLSSHLGERYCCPPRV